MIQGEQEELLEAIADAAEGFVADVHSSEGDVGDIDGMDAFDDLEEAVGRYQRWLCSGTRDL